MTTPRCVALIVHGYAEHCGRYREVAHVLHAATVAQLASPWPDDARLVERMVDVLAA